MMKTDKNQCGQSIIEVIVAVAVLVIIAGSAVIAILGSFSTTRLAEEETQAALFATEGLEAVQSIRNQDWDNLADVGCSPTCGLTRAGNLWDFTDTPDDPDATAKFTRMIAVEDVERDEDGDIVESGGTIDPETKKITSTITWDFTPARSNTVDMVAYLTNWQAGKGEGGAGASETTTCEEYCQSVGFSGGTCRANQQQCTNNSEDYKPQGNQYCTGGASEDTCCCAP